MTGEYPLARFLWIAVNYKPGAALDPLRGNSSCTSTVPRAQSDVVKDGYFPVSPQIARPALASVRIA